MKLVRPALAATAGVLLLSLAACGGGSDSTATDGGQGGQSTGTQEAQQGGVPGGAQGGGRFPGANGLVADISGKTLQVQGQDGQTAVTYSRTTAFTAQVAAKLADVKIGSCVQVSAPQDDASSGSGSDAAAPTAITAETVRITAANDGSCTPGGVGGGNDGDRPSDLPGDLPSDLPGDLPSDLPGDLPSGAPGRGGFGGLGAFGQVTAVSGTGFTVAQQQIGQDGASGETTDVAVTVSADTTYTTTKDATASALAVGKCVSAMGQANDTGTVAAERITVSNAAHGQCTGGFGGFPGGRSGTPGSQQGASQ